MPLVRGIIIFEYYLTMHVQSKPFYSNLLFKQVLMQDLNHLRRIGSRH